MNELTDDAWFAARTLSAPDALRARSEKFFQATNAGPLVGRLSNAGGAALAAATADGTSRAAALDLLAADALITLALLRAAEEDPAALGCAAARLRDQATAAT
jgi:hypothetical protein